MGGYVVVSIKTDRLTNLESKLITSTWSTLGNLTGGSNCTKKTDIKNKVLRHSKYTNYSRYYLFGDNDSVYLTPREAQCLFLICHGYIYRQISTLLSISHRSVEFYVKKAKARLQCNSRSNLVKFLMLSEFMSLYSTEDLFHECIQGMMSKMCGAL